MIIHSSFLTMLICKYSKVQDQRYTHQYKSFKYDRNKCYLFSMTSIVNWSISFFAFSLLFIISSIVLQCKDLSKSKYCFHKINLDLVKICIYKYQYRSLLVRIKITWVKQNCWNINHNWQQNLLLNTSAKCEQQSI